MERGPSTTTVAMERTANDPDAYLRSLRDPRRADLVAIDRLLVEAMPGRHRVMWEGVFWGGTEQCIIGYGDITQPRPRGESVNWFIIGLAMQQRHLSLYVNAVENGRYLGAAYADRLGKVKLGAASIGFAGIRDLDLDVVRELAAHAHRITPADPAVA